MDIVERIRNGRETCGNYRCPVREASKGCVCAMAADEIERLREALREIATDDEDYHHRGHEYRLIARAAIGEEK